MFILILNFFKRFLDAIFLPLTVKQIDLTHLLRDSITFHILPKG